MDREFLTKRAHGIDISQWQETYDYSKTWGQVDFAIQKMTEGTWWDSNYQKLWDKGTSQVPIRGMYHYQRSGVSWKAQADNILEMINKVDLHIVALDIEKINNTLNSSYFADSGRILKYLSDNCDKKIVMYINPDVWNIMYPKFYGIYDSWMFDYDMWMAQYWWVTSPDKNPSVPKTRTDWHIWQYTDRGDSIEYRDGVKMRKYGSPDLNAFNGTVEDMMKWANVTGVITPPDGNPPIIVGDPFIKMTLESVGGKKQVFLKEK